ncbi:helix-turn-helix domain-containing protein [Pseudooceanicola aestuarii]|uniref:arsenate reductase/protein-tyrosine-phosphatase family protein n=1 Tax=Pseudooceanicola aestuarii TaxID=2697319 RepID=UPI0013D0CFE2|nr:helix-turn-helix domain-containing protein [Pseudooceanicola aestuarii]
MEETIPSQLATLGHPQRLAVWRLLMRRYPDAIPAGELAAATGLKASTLSVYLAALRRAGMIEQTREGTSLRYKASLGTAEDLLSYLFADCCRSRPELCLPGLPNQETPVMPYNALFICTGNSARSQFAEALLRDLGGDRFSVHSAGTRPAGEPNPEAMALLEAKGHDVSRLWSKSVGEFQTPDAPVMDFVFTVCDQAANEECPPWPGQPVSGHWGQPDPVKATGTEAERKLAFQQAYGALKNRISAFVALPIEQLDRAALQTRVDDIADTRGEA